MLLFTVSQGKGRCSSYSRKMAGVFHLQFPKGNSRNLKYSHDAIVALAVFLLHLEQLSLSLESSKWKFEDSQCQHWSSSKE